MVQASQSVNRAAADTHERLYALRRRAAAVGLEVEQMLSEHGLATEQLAETLTGNAEAATQEFAKRTRRARKRLAKNAKRTRKELLREAKQATRESRQVARELRRIGKKAASNVIAELETRAAEAQREVGKAAKRAPWRSQRLSHRYWPWLLGTGIAVAAAVGTGYVLCHRSTSPETSHDESDPAASETGGDETNGAASDTGG